MTAVLGELLLNYEILHNATPNRSFQDKGKILIFKGSKQGASSKLKQGSPKLLGVLLCQAWQQMCLIHFLELQVTAWVSAKHLSQVYGEWQHHPGQQLEGEYIHFYFTFLPQVYEEVTDFEMSVYACSFPQNLSVIIISFLFPFLTKSNS